AILDEIKQLGEKEKIKEHAVLGNRQVLEAASNRVKHARAGLEESNGGIISLNSQIENNLSHIAINNQRIEEIDSRRDNLAASIEDAKKRLSLQRERIEKEKKEAFSLDEAMVRLKEEIRLAHEAAVNKAGQSHEAKQGIEAAKEKILTCEGKRVEVNNGLIELGAHLKNILARQRRLKLDKEKMDDYLKESRQVYGSMESGVAQLEEEFSLLKQQKGSLSSQAKDIDKEVERLNADILDKEKALVEMNSCLDLLRDLKIKYEEFPVQKKIRIIFDEKPGKINKLIASLRDAEFSEVNEEGNLRYATEVEAKIISLPEEELVNKIDATTAELERLRGHRQEYKNKQLLLLQQIDEEESVLSQKEKFLAEKSQEKESLSDALRRCQDEYNLVEEELAQCLKEIEDLEATKALQEDDLGKLAEALALAKEALDKEQVNLSLYAEEINQLKIDIAKKDARIKAVDEQKEALFAKVSLLEEEGNNLTLSLASFEQEKEAVKSRQEKLKEECGILTEKNRKEKESLDEVSKLKEKYEKSLAAAEGEVVKIGGLISQEEKDLEDIRGEIYNRRLEVQKMEFEKTKVVDYLKQVYNIDFSRDEIESFDETRESLDADKEQFKKKIDSLGEVNLVAIEEFDDLNKRFEFLNSQKEDMLASQESLRRAISKINRTSKEVFLEVFAKIEEEFKKYFRLLFGGGRAQLILLDRDNVLDSGVEIEVQPPGKKLQSVSLLSGGEKALTAIALIFAIFKVRPSPLCVLDEIDAPLDEANVDRFNRLLKEFSPTAQFIIITHNKKTMSRADVLYGVTMQEKGISKLVSVRFAEETVAS
ncbi:MAG: hypothetical protein ABH858_00185, partial [Candidatus Omnitrophota bacterium]